MRSAEGRLFIYTGVGFAGLWIDLTVGHASAGMPHPMMWLPVLSLPVLSVVSFAAASRYPRLANPSLFMASVLATVLGIVGVAFHALAVLTNLHGPTSLAVLVRLLRYPPLFAPLAISALGILGLIVLRNGADRTDAESVHHQKQGKL